jgi:P4 family phage/plasmid primase-like protien
MDEAYRKKAENGRENIEDMCRFWRHTFGSVSGYLCVVSGERSEAGDELLKVRHRYYPYPSASEAAAKQSLTESGRGKETYYTAHLLKDRKGRKKENAQDIVWLWADLDGAPIPEDPEPSSILETSEGHYHVGWRLSEPIAPDKAEQLNRLLTYLTGADKGKWALATLLRAPHTKNHKRAEEWEVQIVRLDGSLQYEFDELVRLIGPQAESPNGHQRTAQPEGDTDEPPVRLEPQQLRIWMGQAPKLTDDGEIDRSATLYKIGGMLARAGLTKHTITLNLRARDEALGYRKYTGRADDAQYTAIAEKVIEEAAGEPPPRSDASDNAPGASPGKQEPPTDDELRDRLIENYPDYAYGLGEWREYKRGIWEAIDDLAVKDRVLEVLEDAKAEKIRPTRNLMNSVAELLRVRVAKPNRVWDADPNILVCTNGALDLTTRELLPHAKEHYATASVPYAYDEDAISVSWKLVMNDVIGENLGDAAVEFVQEFAGYSLTTDTSHEIAIWLTGRHGGGRSTVLAGLEAMLGPKAGVLSLADIERSSFGLSDLPGKTLVTATEQPLAYLRGGGVLNAIISGEPIQVDRKYRDPIQFVPRCKIAWAMNELPRVGNNDDGIFRRVHILELPEIPEKQRDPRVKKEVYKSGAAILNWALDGLERLKERGYFLVPDTVRRATEDFRQTNDVPAMFIAEACEEVGSESGQRLYDAYKGWCLANGYKHVASNKAAREWRRLGFEKKHTREGERWEEVRVTNAAWNRYTDPRLG